MVIFEFFLDLFDEGDELLLSFLFGLIEFFQLLLAFWIGKIGPQLFQVLSTLMLMLYDGIIELSFALSLNRGLTSPKINLQSMIE